MSKLALNPLPWILDTSFHLDVPSLAAGFDAARSCGFTAVQTDVPADLDLATYAALRDGFGLNAGPGYFGADIAADPADVERAARTHAARLRTAGVSLSFLAADLQPGRLARPAVGFDASAEHLSRSIAVIERAARAMADEGVTAALHPHVGTWVETDAETRAVLDAIDPEVLAFGPDTGHLAWAGIDPVTIVSDYRDRVAGVHLKDVDQRAADKAAASEADYWQATQQLHVWAEPGRGNVALPELLTLVADAPRLEWFVVEVDVPALASPLVSTAYTAGWLSAQPSLRGLLK